MLWNMRWCLPKFCRYISMERAQRDETKMFSGKDADAVEENRGFPLTLKQISGLMIYRKQENFSVEIRFSFKFFLGYKRPARQEMLCFSPHFVYSAP
ncbi:hypothetical protein [Allisonella histaminiformans]|uniref:hypothetical protein n=1 Tax=Allisonella histaminiformans TaxID=209880 RepID=UPI00240A97E1|nr:hypothetical protein [Allisonella histaminiformans]